MKQEIQVKVTASGALLIRGNILSLLRLAAVYEAHKCRVSLCESRASDTDYKLFVYTN